MDNRKKQQIRTSIGTLLRWLALSLLFVGTHALAQTGGTVTYVYTDPQGTPLAEADASGNITATFEYTPYGTYAPQGTSTPGPAPKGPGYTGHVNDPDTSLVYMQARYYDPATGRFLSTDPKEVVAGSAFTFSRYAYANDNPVVNLDPDGRETGIAYHSEFIMMGAQQQNYISPNDAVAGPLQAGMSIMPVIGPGISIGMAIANPSLGNGVVAALSIVPGAGSLVGKSAEAVKIASAGERAAAVAGTMSARTQRAVTIAVTETKEGTRVVSSSEGSLRSAARAALQPGEVAAKGVSGVHAEINGINAAKDMGLTPTGVAASRPICSGCASQIERQGVTPLSPLKNPQ